MTIVHIVLFRFLPTVSTTHKQEFVAQLKTLRSLPCVLDGRFLVGGPSITDPIERSKGYEISLVSFHRDREALDEYQASDEHHRVTSQFLWPYKDDVTRFDFEVPEEDEFICDAMMKAVLGGTALLPKNGTSTP